MMPILNGEAGFVLLGIVLGLSVYIRQVYVDSNNVYDQLKSGALEPRWSLKKQYTQKRLDNLQYVQNKLILVTSGMFGYIIVLSLRLLSETINAIPNDIAWRFKCLKLSDSCLLYWDFALVIIFVASFAFMWMVHHHSSVRERQYHKDMWADFDAGGSEPQPN